MLRHCGDVAAVCALHTSRAKVPQHAAQGAGSPSACAQPRDVQHAAQGHACRRARAPRLPGPATIMRCARENAQQRASVTHTHHRCSLRARRAHATLH